MRCHHATDGLEVIKFHWAQHLSLQSRLGNPRFAWCFPGEDFMGILKDIAEMCMSGTPARMVVPHVRAKWLFGVTARAASEGS